MELVGPKWSLTSGHLFTHLSTPIESSRAKERNSVNYSTKGLSVQKIEKRSWFRWLMLRTVPGIGHNHRDPQPFLQAAFLNNRPQMSQKSSRCRCLNQLGSGWIRIKIGPRAPSYRSWVVNFSPTLDPFKMELIMTTYLKTTWFCATQSSLFTQKGRIDVYNRTCCNRSSPIINLRR